MRERKVPVTTGMYGSDLFEVELARKTCVNVYCSKPFKGSIRSAPHETPGPDTHLWRLGEEARVGFEGDVSQVRLLTTTNLCYPWVKSMSYS